MPNAVQWTLRNHVLSSAPCFIPSHNWSPFGEQYLLHQLLLLLTECEDAALPAAIKAYFTIISQEVTQHVIDGA